MKQMKQVIREDLLEQLRYTAEMKDVLNIATLMDPRYKATFVDDVEATVNACPDEAMTLATEELPGTKQPPAAAQSSFSSSYFTISTKRKDKSLSGLLKKITTAKKIRLGRGEPREVQHQPHENKLITR